jgi:hypothetical protein
VPADSTEGDSEDREIEPWQAGIDMILEFLGYGKSDGGAGDPEPVITENGEMPPWY